MELASEQELLEAAVDRLRALLPEDFQVESVTDEPGAPVAAGEATWLLVAPHYQAELLVHARLSFGPRDVERMSGASGMLRRVLGNRTVLIIAPWLSPRTRASLEAREWSYLDLTGNVRLQMTRACRLSAAPRLG
jgi:hypothetical protein